MKLNRTDKSKTPYIYVWMTRSILLDSAKSTKKTEKILSNPRPNDSIRRVEKARKLRPHYKIKLSIISYYDIHAYMPPIHHRP